MPGSDVVEQQVESVQLRLLASRQTLRSYAVVVQIRVQHQSIHTKKLTEWHMKRIQNPGKQAQV